MQPTRVYIQGNYLLVGVPFVMDKCGEFSVKEIGQVPLLSTGNICDETTVSSNFTAPVVELTVTHGWNKLGVGMLNLIFPAVRDGTAKTRE